MNVAFRTRVYISDVKPSLMQHNGSNPNSTTNSMNRPLSRAFCTNLRFLSTSTRRLSHPQNSNNTRSLSFSNQFRDVAVVSKFSCTFVSASYPTIELHFKSYVFYMSLCFPSSNAHFLLLATLTCHFQCSAKLDVRKLATHKSASYPAHPLFKTPYDQLPMVCAFSS